jgi:CRP-like cAMP-binding protein
MVTNPAIPSIPPAIMRLAALGRLDTDAKALLDNAMQRARTVRARRELMFEGQPIGETSLMLSGWAARIRILEDGRRQILGFLLPGDLMGHCYHDQPVAASTVMTITDVTLCPAPDSGASPGLARTYALSRAHDEAHMLAHITRLGRMNAHERLADLLLELFERLELAGLSTGGRYHMPLTQEMLADALGLTSVHVNRTLQALRREGALRWKGRELVLTDPSALRQQIGRAAIRVTAA